jgi:hypothetical protein
MHERKGKVTVDVNSGMMWCVPAWKLLELLNSEQLYQEREQMRAGWRKM